jgi:hypothetical protein
MRCPSLAEVTSAKHCVHWSHGQHFGHPTCKDHTHNVGHGQYRNPGILPSVTRLSQRLCPAQATVPYHIRGPHISPSHRTHLNPRHQRLGISMSPRSALHATPRELLRTPSIAHTSHKFSDRDLLPSQRLRRKKQLPSTWLQHFTRNRPTMSLARADSGVHNDTMHKSFRPGHDATPGPWRSNRIVQSARHSSFAHARQDVALAPRCDVSETTSRVGEERKIEEEVDDDVDMKSPPKTFDQILKGIGGSRVPTALRE